MTARAPAHRRPRRAAAVLAATGAAAAVLSGCAGSGQPDSATKNAAETTTSAAQGPGDGSGGTSSDGGSSPDTGSAGAASALPDGITPAAAKDLCTSLDDQLQSMRTYTITPGKVTLNGVVVTWAAKNRINPVDLAQHREKIDRTLTAGCPDVRDGVTSALEVPDVASALVGF